MDTFRDSFNHYSFGAVCQFLFEYVAGIRPAFQKFELRPVLGGSLTWAEGSYKTRHGLIKSAWKREGSTYTYTCTVPEGTEAHLILPDGAAHTLTSGNYEFRGKLS